MLSEPNDPFVNGLLWSAARIRYGTTKSTNNAGCPAFEVRIHYPFHPRCGQMEPGMFQRRFAGEDHLVVVQPDGTLALGPCWMAEVSAGSVTLTKCRRLSVDRLIELFETDRATAEIPAARRMTLVR